MKISYAISCVLLLSACSNVPDVSGWQAELLPIAGERAEVPVYEVEFLPVVPTVPGTVIVGRFILRPQTTLRYDDEAYVMAVKQMAAEMGGNTIIYTGGDSREVLVAYVPLEEVNIHGGDEFLLEAGVLAEEL